jgi:hypothetical protein
MKELALEDAMKDVDGLEADLRHGSVVLTRRGTPLALMLSLDRYDREDLEYMTSPGFWQMIEDRRREPTVPWEQVKREMFASTSASVGKA